MRVLLTGGTGYIGSHTAVVLMQSGHEVVMVDNLSNSRSHVVGKVQSITGMHPVFIEGDIRDTKLLTEIIQESRIEAVIHFAGLKAVGESMLKPIDYYANNVQGTVSLLQAMQASQVSNLVFSSSATVYGDPQYLPIDEAHPTSATSPYGRCKLHIEEMLADVANSSREWRIACLRYFNPVGAHESGLIGEEPHGIPNNLMPYIVGVAAGSFPAVNVFGDDYPTADGTGVRDYIHIMDLAEGHRAALDFLRESKGWHAINLGAGQGYSVLEMVQAFEKACSLTIPYMITGRRAGDVAACYAEANKARKLLAWKAMRGLAEMCESAWSFKKRSSSNDAKGYST